MLTEKLTSQEKKALKKEQRPSFLLGVSLIFVLSALNILFYFKDIVLGIDGLERPPVSQLIIIEIIAAILGITLYYYLAKNVLGDIKAGAKQVESTSILQKFFKRIDGDLVYLIRLKNGLETTVDKTTYTTFNEGDNVDVRYSPRTKLVHSLSQQKY